MRSDDTTTKDGDDADAGDRPRIKRKLKGGTAITTLTIVTSYNPTRLTKKLWLDPEGRLQKEEGGNLLHGHAETVKIDGVRELKDIILGLKTNQAFIHGVPVRGYGGDIYAQGLAPAGALTRTKPDWCWPGGSAFMLFDLDHDPSRKGAKPFATAADVRHSLITVCPALAPAPMLIMPSARSFVYDTRTDAEIIGPRGWHAYVPAVDGSDIPRAGRAFGDLSWLAGHAYFAVSKSGQLLERTLFDLMVWQPYRLDFASGVECVPPLVQRRPDPVLFNAGGERGQ
jgi:hypothetical protein